MPLKILFLTITLYSSIIGLIKIGRLDIPLKLLTLLLMGTLVSAMIFSVSTCSSWSGLLTGKIYFAFHILVSGAIYYHLFTGQLLRNIIAGITICFSVFFIVFTTINGPALYMSMTNALLLTTYSVLYFFKLFRTPSEEEIVNSSKLWFNSGMLMYFASSFVLRGSFFYLYPQGSTGLNPEHMLIVLRIFQYCLFGISLLLHRAK